MNQVKTVEMDVVCELASEIVERQWRKENAWRAEALDNGNILEAHSFTDENGDIRYIEEVQDEFNKVLDIIDSILNPEF